MFQAYQTEAVSRWFYRNSSFSYKTYNYNGSASSIGANGGQFNRYGRAIPDVAALGTNFTIVLEGCFEPMQGSGTSAAAPTFASIIYRINAERIAVGKSPVGFINPVLYQNPQILNDVVKGASTGCDGSTLDGGFKAGIG